MGLDVGLFGLLVPRRLKIVAVLNYSLAGNSVIQSWRQLSGLGQRMVDKRIEEAASNSPDTSSRYVWDGDAVLPNSGEVELAIGESLLTFDLRFPHERRYALGLLYAYRNP